MVSLAESRKNFYRFGSGMEERVASLSPARSRSEWGAVYTAFHGLLFIRGNLGLELRIANPGADADGDVASYEVQGWIFRQNLLAAATESA